MNQQEQRFHLGDDFGFQAGVSYDPEPGMLLKKVLQEIFDSRIKNNDSFAENLDYIFAAEGEIKKMIYESLVNYFVRRLINTGDYLRRQILKEVDFLIESEKENIDVWGTLYERLRIFFKSQTRIPEEDAERIIAALVPCIQIKNQDPKINKVKRKRIISKQRQANGELRCYICGCSTTKEDSVIEHSWPKAFGGSKSLDNLRVACNACNSVKDDHIQATDFHYERISLVCHENEPGFITEINRVEFYKIALWAKSDYSCTACGKKAEEVGKLDFTRRNLDDSWHFLNIDAICLECKDLVSLEEGFNHE